MNLITDRAGQDVRTKEPTHSQEAPNGTDWLRFALISFDLLSTLGVLSLVRDAGTRSAGHSATIGESNVGIMIAMVMAIMFLGALRAYDPATRLPGARLRTCAQLVLGGGATVVVAALASHDLHGTLNIHPLVAAGIALPLLWIGARVVATAAERRHPSRTLVVGTGKTACHIWELSLRHRECALNVVGFVDDDPLALPAGAPATLGRLDDLPRLVAEERIDLVVVAYANAVDSDLLGLLRALDGRVRIQVVPRLYELVQARGVELGRLSMLDAGGISPRATERGVKRALDIIIAAGLLLAFVPLFATITIAIKCEDRGPILYRQRTAGRRNRAFYMLKFRTMTEDAESKGHELIKGLAIEDAVRQLKEQSVERHVTRIGRHLRRASLDELPQLWNVLRGQMSLVGPRPMPRHEVQALTRWQYTARHSVRPGMTGLWQVSGRNATTWDERVQLDCVYARHWAVTTDLRILARTVGVVLRRSGSM